MSPSLYVATVAPSSGKSLVSLGVMELPDIVNTAAITAILAQSIEGAR